MAQALIVNLLMAGAMAYTVWGWSQGRLTVGDLVFVNTYLTQLFRPLDMLGMVYRTIRQGLIDMAAMFELIDTPVEVRRHARRAGAGDPPPVDRRSRMSGSAMTRTAQILHGLSFEVEAGQPVALVGPSGAGKIDHRAAAVPLLRSAARPHPDRRAGHRRGHASNRLRAAHRHRAAGHRAVQRHHRLQHRLWPRRRGDDGGRGAAHGAAIAEFIERLPEGYDTEVGERGLKLSGGEKQRVAIARTLVKNPPILIFDEATSALDTRTEQEILATLRKVAQHRTTLVIAHRLSTVADSDSILVLEHGKLVEQGSHIELLRLDGLYAEMWARQAAEGEVEGVE